MQPMMKKLALSQEDVMKYLAGGRDGVLSTNGANGYPYGVPVNYILKDGKIYFHGRGAGEKYDNVIRDARVCFTVYAHEAFEVTGPETCNVTTDYTSVIVKGRAEEVTDQAVKEEILYDMVKMLVPEKDMGPVNPHAAAAASVFSITIESATGKKHPAMPGNRTI